MKREPLRQEDLAQLSAYGLGNPPPEDCVRLCFQAGEVLAREGMPFPYLLLVVRGRIKVCAAAKNGRDLVLCYYLSGGVLGDMELMTDSDAATATTVAITDLTCIAIPWRRNAARLRTNTVFLNRVGAGLSEKLAGSSRNLVSAALYGGEARLCAYLLQNAYRDVFRDTLTDTACSVGMSYRHLFRLLDRLCREGLLEKRPEGYRLLDREALGTKAAGLLEE